jgi:hypothetical protein
MDKIAALNYASRLIAERRRWVDEGIRVLGRPIFPEDLLPREALGVRGFEGEYTRLLAETASGKAKAPHNRTARVFGLPAMREAIDQLARRDRTKRRGRLLRFMGIHGRLARRLNHDPRAVRNFLVASGVSVTQESVETRDAAESESLVGALGLGLPEGVEHVDEALLMDEARFRLFWCSHGLHVYFADYRSRKDTYCHHVCGEHREAAHSKRGRLRLHRAAWQETDASDKYAPGRRGRA